MSFWEAVLSSLKAIWANKMRSFLTMLGVMIGIFSVAVLISIARASTSEITESIEGSGSNMIVVYVLGTRSGNNFDMDNVEEMSQLEGIKYTSPYVNGEMTLKNGTESMDINVVAANDQYDNINNYKLLSGRWISDTDEYRRNRVVVVGVDVAKDLYGTLDVVGETISLEGTKFTIIGVLEEQGDNMMGSSDEIAIIPFKTGQRLMDNTSIYIIYFGAESSDVVDTAKTSLENYMLDEVTDGDEDGYGIYSQSEILDMLDETTTTLTYLLGAIGGISLLVGGIGIMNIMLVSVSERTREIGVRKAIGATRANILTQFLIEAIIVSGLGGVFGIILANIGMKVASTLMKMEMGLDGNITLVALAFAVAVGVIFGIYPANKASKLNPIEALRYE